VLRVAGCEGKIGCEGDGEKEVASCEIRVARCEDAVGNLYKLLYRHQDPNLCFLIC
jgi:hypothetical protein